MDRLAKQAALKANRYGASHDQQAIGIAPLRILIVIPVRILV
jgi:hypothetical protein